MFIEFQSVNVIEKQLHLLLSTNGILQPEVFSISVDKKQRVSLKLKYQYFLKDRAFNAQERLSSTVTLTVVVSDVNDQAPVFQYDRCTRDDHNHCLTPTYSSTVSFNFIHINQPKHITIPFVG